MLLMCYVGCGAGANAAELIPVCAEGVRETVHPLSFVARQMFKEMLANPVRACAVGLNLD